MNATALPPRRPPPSDAYEFVVEFTRLLIIMLVFAISGFALAMLTGPDAPTQQRTALGVMARG
ncbi:hypothetical protein LGH83_04425 [Lichenihabitans sp. PAMC28606]|uniref:hypothetical protein n=1 Tax=Lichenihabitans sp. PAMC28606 TaxID=2880932 RepID=UPI001D0A2D53|nr:hypothetical protein [Lichenihabitans sp. PAMC28606]UDL95472.1 hypothetical protein LGH83_04425 [Lichenihabitans sp. PAMC28606]